jgi:septum site-determining protein MinC
MNRDIIIKSNRHGLTLYLSEEIPFASLRDKIRKKFSESKKFFGSAEMALTLEGKTLSSSEINEVVSIISDETDLSIISVIDNSEINDRFFQDKLRKLLNNLDLSACEIYPSSIEGRNSCDFKHSVLILGDVGINSEVHTNGSVFILGRCLGKIFAGELGNKNAMVYAAIMQPQEINIADVSFDRSAFFKSEASTKKKGLFTKAKPVELLNIPYLLSLDSEGECVYKKIE